MPKKKHKLAKIKRLDKGSFSLGNLLAHLIINVFTLMVVEYIVPGFKFADIYAALMAAVVIGVVNTFIRPVLQIIALPISILTLGVFAFLINVALLWSVSKIVPGFTIESFSTAIIASILMALVSWFLHKLAKD
jgi:putative membrane protein